MRANTTLAAIDIGSNTIQFLLAEISGGKIISRKNGIATTRLGAVAKANYLAQEAIDNTAEAIKNFANIARQANAQKLRIIATSAVRDADNKQDFLDAISKVTPAKVEILSGKEEALMSYRGAKSLLSFPYGTPVLDVGGSSTELIYGFSPTEIHCTSVNIGSVRMKQNNWSVDEMNRILTTGFRCESTLDTAIGIGGTITSTAGVLLGLKTYEREAIEGITITTQQIDDLLNKLLPLSLAERCAYSPLFKKRGEIIEQGLRIWLGLANLLGFGKITVCGGGILDGAIAEMLETEIS